MKQLKWRCPKFLAVLLAFLMVFSAMPLSAFADEALALTQALYNGTEDAPITRLDGVTNVTLYDEDHAVQSCYVVNIASEFTDEDDLVVLLFNDEESQFMLADGNGDEVAEVDGGAAEVPAFGLEPITDEFSISGFEKDNDCEYYLLFSADSLTAVFDGRIAILLCADPNGAASDAPVLTQALYNGTDNAPVNRLDGVSNVTLYDEDHAVQSCYQVNITGEFSGEDDLVVLLFDDDEAQFMLADGNGDEVAEVDGGAAEVPAFGLEPITDEFSISGFEKDDDCEYYLLFSADSLTAVYDGKIAILLCVRPNEMPQEVVALTQALFNGEEDAPVTRLDGVSNVTLFDEDHAVQSCYQVNIAGEFTDADDFLVLIFDDEEAQFLLVDGNGDEIAEVDGGVAETPVYGLDAITDEFSIAGLTIEDGSEYYLLFSADSSTYEFDEQLAILLCVTPNGGGEEADPPVILTQPVAETTCDKNDEVTLSVVADETLGQNLSYQWYSDQGTPVFGMRIISGATSSTYTVPTDYAGTTTYYCVVTNTTAGGKTNSVTSDTAVVTTRLTYVNAPTVEIYGGGEGTYYEYGSPGAFQISAKATDIINFTNITVQVYCNDQDSTEGGELVWEFVAGYMTPPVNYDSQALGGASIPGGKPAGTYYYYAEVSMDYDGVTYTAVSATKAITYLPYADLVGDNLEGTGSEEDPFRIRSLADLEYLQAMVNRANRDEYDWYIDKALTAYSFEGAYFRMESDIELPVDWQPIGATKPFQPNPRNGQSINPFSGIFDGGGHTITVAEGGKPLFGYVRGATIRNLNIFGTQIAGEGLVDDYSVDYGPDGNSGTGIPATANIDHVTILSGTRTLGSGLIGGYASGQNIVNITNCTVQDDVIIGYQPDEQVYGIGSFAGSFNGTISNCVSYATVNGESHAGGIVGRKGQSMGPFSVTDCEFYGTVNCEGNYAGGIVGAGYNSNSAPNSPCVDIENCIVNASVTGANYVGGVFGGEGGIVQAWQGDTNVGTIRNNEFRGTVAATAEGGIAGGVIGIMLSLNKNNVIENNYYASGCGAERGIGAVRIVDTDAMGETPAWNDDHTVLYINTSVDDLMADDDAVREIVGGSYALIQERNDNRSDDPLGADAANLCHTDEPLSFTDVTDPEEFYYDPVYWAVDRGITTGWEESDGTHTFRPWNKCNRAAVITFLWRLAGEPEPTSMATFSDMTNNDEFNKAISWAVEQGIVTGWADNTFRPWNTCNRAAIVTFLWRYAGKPEPKEGYEPVFTDMTNNEEFNAAINWAASYGITTGWDDGTFRPWNQCNRAAVMSFLYRMANLD